MQNDTIRHALRHSCHLPGLRHNCHRPGLKHTHLGCGVPLVPSSCFRPSPGTPSKLLRREPKGTVQEETQMRLNVSVLRVVSAALHSMFFFTCLK